MIEVHSADIMAALLIMKAEIEDRKGSYMRMVFSGATEAHLLAKEISKWYVYRGDEQRFIGDQAAQASVSF